MLLLDFLIKWRAVNITCTVPLLLVRKLHGLSGRRPCCKCLMSRLGMTLARNLPKTDGSNGVSLWLSQDCLFPRSYNWTMIALLKSWHLYSKRMRTFHTDFGWLFYYLPFIFTQEWRLRLEPGVLHFSEMLLSLLLQAIKTFISILMLRWLDRQESAYVSTLGVRLFPHIVIKPILIFLRDRA